MTTMRTPVLQRMRHLLVLAMLLLATGCQGGFPADTQGTLDRASGGELRVGIAENPPWTQVAPDGTVSGREVELLEGYATTILTDAVADEREDHKEMILEQLAGDRQATLATLEEIRERWTRGPG